MLFHLALTRVPAPSQCCLVWLFQMPLAQTCLASENPYQRKGGLMCLAVLAEGCADHIRTKYAPNNSPDILLGSQLTNNRHHDLSVLTFLSPSLLG